MRYLLDTNVFRLIQNPTAHDRARENALAWFDGIDDDEIWLSAMTIREVSRGIENLSKTKPEVASALQTRVDALLAAYGRRVVEIDTVISAEWGRLEGERAKPGKVKGHDDLAFVATARLHDMVLVTRNVKDVRGTGVRVLNPCVKPWRVRAV